MANINNDVEARINAKIAQMQAEIKGEPKTEQKQNTVFDGKVDCKEKRTLRKDEGLDLTRKDIREYSKYEGGQAFLDKVANLNDPKKIQTAALDFFIGDVDLSDGDSVRKDLAKFGVTDEQISERLELNFLNKNRPMGSVLVQTQFGEVPTPKRVDVVHDKEGNITGIHLYESWSGKDDNPTTILTKQGEYFVTNGEDPEYYTYNEKTNQLKNHTQAIKDEAEAKAQKEAAAATQNEILENLKKAAEEEIEPQEPKFGLGEDVQQPVTKGPDFKEVFAKNKKVNIDETGSKQRLTKNEQWNTNLVVPKKATFNEEGLPDRIAIELPSDYGSVGPDGVGQKRYQILYRNNETGRYADKNGIREFEMNITDDGINLKQYDPDDKKIQAFLNKNTIAVQEKAQDAALNEKNKMDIPSKTPEQVKNLMNLLSDRNNSWETYTQVGTEVGHLTGAYGLLEELVDSKNNTGIKTYNDLKPAIDGLMARVPESVVNTPEYEAVQKIISEMAEHPDDNLHSKMFFNFGGGVVRDLDKALMNLAEKHLAGQIQGANHANNRYLVGGQGSVVITPSYKNGAISSDAQFHIGGNTYEMHSGGTGQGGRTVDFQDLVEYSDDGTLDKLSLIRNEVTGNNRHGEIRFDHEKAMELKNLRFNDGNNSYDIKVEDVNGMTIAFVYSPDGKTKVPVEDVLNGRKPMPQNVA